MLTKEVIEGLAPRPRTGAAKQKIWDAYVTALLSDEVREFMDRYHLNTEARLEQALAQWLWECGYLTIIWESGAYSEKQILNIFGVGRHSAKVTAAEAKRLAGNGYALFERVYGIGNPKKARELGNKVAGDGYAHRGLGIQQLTGRRDHERLAAKLGIDKRELADAKYSIFVAIMEWDEKGCNAIADKKTGDSCLAITRKINGGTNGLAGRRALLAKAQRLVRPEHFAKTQKKGVGLGANGDEVLLLQQMLNACGYMCPIDGDFGAITEQMLIAFQAQHGLNGGKPTKIFDGETKEALSDARLDAELKPPKTEIRNVDVADLREAGSKQIAFWDRIGFVGKVSRWLGYTTGGGVVGKTTYDVATSDTALGLLDTAESAVQTGQRAREVGQGAADLLIWGYSPLLVFMLLALLLTGGVLCLGWWLGKMASRGIADRVESAATGSNQRV